MLLRLTCSRRSQGESVAGLIWRILDYGRLPPETRVVLGLSRRRLAGGACFLVLCCLSRLSHTVLSQCSHKLQFNSQYSIINIEYSGLLRHSSPGISPQRLVVCLTLEPRARTIRSVQPRRHSRSPGNVETAPEPCLALWHVSRIEEQLTVGRARRRVCTSPPPDPL